MGTITEERKRERPSKIAFLSSILSFLPFCGVIFIFPALFLTGLFYFLSKKNPEKYGGIFRLRVSFILCLIAIIFQYGLFFTFFKFKIEQAEEAKYKITIMRLYSAAGALENYEKSKGVYPIGESAGELEKQLDEEKIEHLPFKDGWERELLVESRMWDYSLTAGSPPKEKRETFPILKAQKPKPVFPFVGSYEQYDKLSQICH
ncbi:MAG: hypothetical protein ACE14Q_08430 [Acidobacteriota bacterium]|nr:hypothetical protein [Thermoanaerobaculaceae bacterium]